MGDDGVLTDGTERRQWDCEECGAELTYPETRVLEHYAEEHGEDYGDLIGQYQTGDGEWKGSDEMGRDQEGER